MVTGIADFYASPVLDSPRYRQYRKNLYQKVSRPSFTGYWAIRGSMTSPKPPRDCDVVLLYLHGGGYISSHPGIYLLFLLRLADALLQQGLSVSIFALDYRLAPENAFPAQLEDIMEAYSYLINDMEIPAAKILVGGDSAGGHLTMSFLINIHQPSVRILGADKSIRLPKPGGALLVSPWVNPLREPDDFRNKTHIDVCSGTFLYRCGLCFVRSMKLSKAKKSPYINLINSIPLTDWKSILPAWTWISAGKDEILFDDIEHLVNELEEGAGPGRIEFSIEPGDTHVWQWLETVDEEPKKDYLMGKGEQWFRGIEQIGRVIGKKVKR